MLPKHAIFNPVVEPQSFHQAGITSSGVDTPTFAHVLSTRHHKVCSQSLCQLLASASTIFQTPVNTLDAEVRAGAQPYHQ